MTVSKKLKVSSYIWRTVALDEYRCSVMNEVVGARKEGASDGMRILWVVVSSPARCVLKGPEDRFLCCAGFLLRFAGRRWPYPFSWMFFCVQLVGDISLIPGPVSQYHENWTFYSAVRPTTEPGCRQPTLTCDDPASTESDGDHVRFPLLWPARILNLDSARSVLAVKKAMQTYARLRWTCI
ncbi:hypothetical protein C8F01DRAFT_1086599 [Mycena amicta]|nr:hypothetical protein C8F01DRAFT_1086599 [Mycena amicta]